MNLGMGRITGSASIETLVRVGIEKEHGLSPDSKMVVLHDFTPCVDDELEVKRGQIVNILYRENDWVYVISQDSRQEGFIPHSYCVPYNSELANLAIKKKLPRNSGNNTTGPAELNDVDVTADIIEDTTRDMQHCSLQQSQNSLISSEPDFLPFQKDPSGRFIVLYTFIARDENDVSVERGEFVTVLNREDPDWFWIVRSDGQEGFIPSGFVYPAETILQNQMNKNGNLTDSAQAVNSVPAQQTAATTVATPATAVPANTTMTNDTQQQQNQQGTELIILYDFKAQAPDDLSVKRGDWIYADMSNQTVDGWLWCYSPKTRKYGFIPKAYARPFNKPLSSL